MTDAERWYDAEWNGAPPVPWKEAPAGQRMFIKKRVAQLSSGIGDYDVADLTPGDIAILRTNRPQVLVGAEPLVHLGAPYRTQFIKPPVVPEKDPPDPWRIPEWLLQRYGMLEAEDGHEVELRIGHWYDSFVEERDFRFASARLFGNTNIGYLQRSNMQTYGQLWSHDVLITSWWVTCKPRTPEIEDRLQDWIFTLYVGDRVVQQANGYDLVRGRQPIVAHVPMRQHFNVNRDAFDNGRPPLVLEKLTVHVEGWKKCLRY